MRRRISGLTILVGLIALGCGPGSTVVETGPRTAPEILAMARRFESEGKLKQATASYQQVIQRFPDSAEAKTAADQIARSQREATQRVKTRQPRR